MQCRTGSKSVHVEPQSNLGLMSGSKSILPTWLLLAIPLTSAPTHSEEINTLAPNANCDIVSIRQAEKKVAGDEDKVDWFAFGRDHREFTGKELLPEHQKAEPERDVITGCAIRNEETEAKARAAAEEEAEVAEMTSVGWAKQSSQAQVEEEPEPEESEMRPQEKTTETTRNWIETLIESNSLLLQFFATILFTLLAIGLAFGLRLVIQIITGLMQRRRVCLIPCSLVAPGREITGHMSVIGLRTFRFVPIDNAEMQFFKRTLDEPHMHFFTVEVGDMSFDVFVDGIRGYYSPVAFDEKLTPKQQKEILEHSTVAPQIGQLIVVPYDVKKHKKHKANRAKLPPAAETEATAA